jgi:hypothetical protein
MLSKKHEESENVHPLSPALGLQLSPHTAHEEKSRNRPQALLVPLLACHCDHQVYEESKEFRGVWADGRKMRLVLANEPHPEIDPHSVLFNGFDKSR